MSIARRVDSHIGSCGETKPSSGMKTAPELGLLTRPFTDRPGKPTAWVIPGVLSAMSLILRITASVRSMVAASGSWAMPTR